MNEHVSPQAVERASKPRALPQRVRRRLLNLSAVLFVVVPTLLAGVYYVVIAANQYAVEVRFAVRGADGASNPDLLSSFIGTSAPGSATTDAYILMDYLRSRQMIEDLSKRLDLDAIFN